MKPGQSHDPHFCPVEKKFRWSLNNKKKEVCEVAYVHVIFIPLPSLLRNTLHFLTSNLQDTHLVHNRLLLIINVMSYQAILVAENEDDKMTFMDTVHKRQGGTYSA